MSKVLLSQLLQLAGAVALAVAVFYSPNWNRGFILGGVVSFLVGRFLSKRVG